MEASFFEQNLQNGGGHFKLSKISVTSFVKQCVSLVLQSIERFSIFKLFGMFRGIQHVFFNLISSVDESVLDDFKIIFWHEMHIPSIFRLFGVVGVSSWKFHTRFESRIE